MALLRSCLSDFPVLSATIWPRKDWRPGMSKALMRPWQDAETDDLVNGDDFGEGERGEGEGLNRGEDLSPDEEVAAIETVDEDAGEGGEEEGGDLSGKAYDTEEKCGAGEAIDEPTGGDAGHPGADERDGLADEEEAEVAMAEGSPGVSVAAAWGRCVGGIGHFCLDVLPGLFDHLDEGGAGFGGSGDFAGEIDAGALHAFGGFEAEVEAEAID